MIRLTVEEMNLLSIYHEGSKAQLMENMTAALPFMDEDMRPFAERILQKIYSISTLNQIWTFLWIPMLLQTLEKLQILVFYLQR